MENEMNAPRTAQLKIEGSRLLGSSPTFRDQELQKAETRATGWKVVSFILLALIALIALQSYFPQIHRVLPWSD